MKLICTQCGADGEMNCECGVAFIAIANSTPKAAQVAAALADPANAAKSDRAIADELGIADRTVNRARRTATNVAVEKRIGKDGKARSAPKPKLTLVPPLPRADFSKLDIGTERIGSGMKGQPVQLMPAQIQKLRDSRMRVSDTAARVERAAKIDLELFEEDVAKMLAHARGSHDADRDFAKDARKDLELIEANVEEAIAKLAKLRQILKDRDAA